MNTKETNEESWKQTYREKGDLWKIFYPDGYLEFKCLKKLLKKAKRGMNLLEVGIGTGEAALPFLKKGLQITGIDITKEALEICRTKFLNSLVNPKNFYLEQSSLQEYQFPKRKFDIIIDYYTSQHISRTEQDTFYQQVSSTLKRGGMFLLGQYSKDYIEVQKNLVSKGDGVFISDNRYFCVVSIEDMIERLTTLGFTIESVIPYPTKGFYEILAISEQ